MTWVKVDDQFQDHPKFLDVSLAGVGLWVAGLAYCSRYLTDGFIAASAVKRLGGNKKLTDELVNGRLWRQVEGGWIVHDYTHYNPCAEKIRDTREKRAEAGKRGGRARGEQKRLEASSKQIAKQIAKQTQDTSESFAEPLLSPRPVRDGFCVTTSPPPTSPKQIASEEEDREASKIIGEALTIVAERRLAKRSPDRQPIVDLAAWFDKTTGSIFDQHCERLLAMANEGLDAEAIADALEPLPGLALADVVPIGLPPQCAECGGIRHHPDQPHLLDAVERARIHHPAGGAS